MAGFVVLFMKNVNGTEGLMSLTKYFFVPFMFITFDYGCEL